MKNICKITSHGVILFQMILWQKPTHFIKNSTTLHSSDPPPPPPYPPPPPPSAPLFKGEGGGVNFDYLPWRGGIWKIKKGGGDMVQGQVFLKGGTVTFPIWFFQDLSFLPLEITLPLAKFCYAYLKKKNFFFCHHNFMQKDHSKLSKMNMKMKMPHKLR